MVVSGQVVASKEAFLGVNGMPSEQDLAKSVRKLPSSLTSTMKVPGIDMLSQTGQVIKCVIGHEQQKKWFSFQETFPVMDAQGEPLAGGLYIQEQKQMAGIQFSRFIMYDAENKPVCVAKHDGEKPLQRVYFITRTTPMRETDEPIVVNFVVSNI